MIYDDWHPWFAWYPVRLRGYFKGTLWYPSAWAWLCRVEWSEGHMTGDWIYREIAPAERGRDE